MNSNGHTDRKTYSKCQHRLIPRRYLQVNRITLGEDLTGLEVETGGSNLDNKNICFHLKYWITISILCFNFVKLTRDKQKKSENCCLGKFSNEIGSTGLNDLGGWNVNLITTKCTGIQRLLTRINKCTWAKEF